MKPKVKFLLCICLLVSISVHGMQSVKWDKTPIRINLKVGIEQIIHFPENGQVGLPALLAQQSVFSTLFAGETAYWTAHQPFEKQRIKVRLTTGEYILFDATATIDDEKLNASIPLNVVIADGNDTALSIGSDKASKDKATIFDLIRYAAQSTYSPIRLIEPVFGIREVPVGITGNLNTLYNHQNHKGLVLFPQQSWSVDGIYVTSVIVINNHSHEVVLDNRLVQHTNNASFQGVEQHFIASSFYRNTLSKLGEKGDRTTLFIVTNQPFQSVLRLGDQQ